MSVADALARAAAADLFVCKRTPTIMDGLVFRWQLKSEFWQTHSSPGEVSVSRNGVLVSGVWPVFQSETELEAFSFVLATAWAVFRNPGAFHIDGFEPPGWEVVRPRFGGARG